jgi:hypothetical protein
MIGERLNKERRFEAAVLIEGRLPISPPWEKTCICPKIFRTAAQPSCQIRQVKAIRAVARFPYLVFLRVRCPSPFFAPCVSRDSVSFS